MADTGDTDEDVMASGREPSLDGLLGQMSGLFDGWSGLDGDKSKGAMERMHAEQSKTLRREAAKFRDLFLGSQLGREVLDIMLDMTLRKAAWHPFFDFRDAAQRQEFGLFREGQNSFVAAILDAIAAAENRQPNQRRDTI